MKLKLNDKVKIVAGKDKGKTGKVTGVIPKQNKVVVKGMNIYRKHMKRQSDKNPGGIVEIERPLPVANVQLICPSCKVITRVGYSVTKTGDKVRICRKCNNQLDIKTK